MDQMMLDSDDPLRRRQPFTDASSRINHSKSPKVETPRVKVEEFDQLKTPDRMSVVMSPTPGEKENQRLSVATDWQTESARNSVVSAASILSGKGKRKTHVGPWQLGRTLGKGATGRVRLAKHAVTGQTAAIKIVSKKSAAMVQSESIAAMDRNSSNFAGFSNTRQMPCGIEREVVIMKLIEHSNVISLYDVWENRGELYLVLEYVEGGELFDYVSQNGPLPEEEAVRLFRQIIAGLGYCHRFNICHRDLKPENILLDGNHNVKLADFGMAALQPAGHWLNTSCGSPHYAAPEIIYGRKYRGDRADMWSCGIILYALLTGYLPFDGGDLPNTLRLVKKGEYMIPQELSCEAANLITRILQKRPEDRISMPEIWAHPLLTKYEKLHNAMADYYIGPPPPLSIKDCGAPVTSRSEIDMDILRNLQTLWHDVKPEGLIQRVMSLEPTHERMFYNSLVKFRDEQLENYQGQPLEYSASDYHHISKFGERAQRGRTETGGTNSKRRSPAIKNLHRRLGNTQEPMSPASVQSYDPFRSPKAQGTAVEAKFAQITVHHAVPEIPERGEVSPVGKPPPSIMEVEEPEDENEASDSPFTVLQKRKHKPNSMKSLQSSKMPNSSSRLPGLSTHSTSYRRNVSFRHARNRSQGSTKPKRRKTTTNQQGELKRSPSAASLQMIADGLSVPDMPSSPPLPAQPTVVRSGNKVKNLDPPKRFRQPDIVWKEDARKVSHELSQICEEAFNGSSVTTIRTASTSTETGYETPTTPISMASPERVDQLSNARNSYHPPRESSRSYSIQELTETRQKLVDHSSGRTDNIPGYLSGVIGHLDRLIEEEQSQKFSKGLEDNEPRYVDPFSIPTPPTGELPLPAISEEFASPVRGSPDEVSPKRKPKLRHTTRHGDGKATIRMVPHSSLRSMEEVKPLMIRKKNQLAEPETQSTDPMRAFSAGSRQSRNPGGLDPISEVPGSPKKDEKSTENKKWSWFRARSQTSDPLPALPPKDTPQLSRPQSPTRPEGRRVPTRKTSMERFGGALKKLVSKKSNKTPQPVIGRLNPRSCTGFPLRLFEDKDSANPKDRRQSELLCKGYPETDSSFEADDPQNPFHNKRRSIANHNWFARIFQLKPATRVIALNTGKVKGRKVVHHLLLDWEDYGMEDVRLDKANSVVHGRVGEVNFLRLREVEFTAEFYTVLEHGRQANLSLVKFKQERGAASSFNKVVDTVHQIMKSRGLIVEDPTRAKKMARVLDTIPSP
ncbi:uncharacterized protein N7484_001080 [Penicillium longicatenatum]|uniref:uncharacterized protein n=1 Tax=Penicillium longicatenatum TaxID=1561947 RepID=UPI0025482680|nr:uncharacterized protein N7484_001080 [Penicillium longicatenatum]KAJ5657431.1 hypothetical protein N7484_001080 [Penicillium longicatenatum]